MLSFGFCLKVTTLKRRKKTFKSFDLHKKTKKTFETFFVYVQVLPCFDGI